MRLSNDILGEEDDEGALGAAAYSPPRRSWSASRCSSRAWPARRRPSLPANECCATTATAPGYPEWALDDGPAQRAVIGSALLLAVIALLALGIGAIFRHSAMAISSLLALLFVALIFAPLLPERAGDLVQQALPGAGFAVQQTVARDDAIPIAPWAGLGVAFAWAAGALLLAYVLIRIRDA
jgi:hypothetical protein